MNAQPIPPQGNGLDLGDIYYVLFRHKWKIVLCTLAGLATAFAIYRSDAPPYQSEAKLLVRYIVSESKATGPTANNATTKIMPDERGASVMNTEKEILGSIDLARAVAEDVGPERVLAKAGGGNDLNTAVGVIRNGLSIYIGQGSSVIHIVYRHPDPEVVRPVLASIVDRYLKLHVETHRAVGMLGDSLAQEADTLRMRLSQTEDELRRELNKTGVISLESAKEEINSRMVSIRREISNLESDLAGRVAIYEDIRKRRPGITDSSNENPAPKAESDVPPSVVEQMRLAMARAHKLQEYEQDLLLQFTPETPRVKQIHAQRVEAEAAVESLRDRFPSLAKIRSTNTAVMGPDAEANEAASAWLQITANQGKIKELSSQLTTLKAESAKLDSAEGAIFELRRKKEIEEANYRYYAANLEQARISQTLGNGKVSNITQIQSPSPAFRIQMNLKKVGMAAAAGILIGFGWAFLIELVLDRSVRRPTDLQRMLRAPLFLSIPRLTTKSLNRPASLALTAGEPSSTSPNLPSERGLDQFAGGPLRLFHETLRDRLIAYFESKNLTHKPKLVAVSGLCNSCGVTTTAAGLARSLSETGEGNVLLVDMTVGQGAAHQFIKGREACGLDDLLEARSKAHVNENLYVVTESSHSDILSRSLPQRFSKLVPKLKASDFDYIIFDMPPVNQLSITPRLAGFMDMVLLVIESEKSDREVVADACSLLAESKAHVGLVLNKTRSYVPAALQQALMAG